LPKSMKKIYAISRFLPKILPVPILPNVPILPKMPNIAEFLRLILQITLWETPYKVKKIVRHI
jgi:hypothetical protein